MPLEAGRARRIAWADEPSPPHARKRRHPQRDPEESPTRPVSSPCRRAPAPSAAPDRAVRPRARVTDPRVYRDGSDAPSVRAAARHASAVFRPRPPTILIRRRPILERAEIVVRQSHHAPQRLHVLEHGRQRERPRRAGRHAPYRWRAIPRGGGSRTSAAIHERRRRRAQVVGRERASARRASPGRRRDCRAPS